MTAPGASNDTMHEINAVDVKQNIRHVHSPLDCLVAIRRFRQNEKNQSTAGWSSDQSQSGLQSTMILLRDGLDAYLSRWSILILVTLRFSDFSSVTMSLRKQDNFDARDI